MVNLGRAAASVFLFGALAATLFSQSPKYKLGHTPTADELKSGEDSAVSSDGRGLPPGSGTAEQGRDVYERRCQRCHGPKGEGADAVALAGGQGTLKSAKPLKTVGSYWPYATTLWDYVHRAMPFNQPGILTNDQVYAVTAYILNLNGIIAPTFVIDAASLPKVQMPNRNGFVADPRPDVGKRKK